ncbi:MAG: hypothetical protein IPN53_20080 [Comamonadaceae bacterium]|nr:hypothetical protein [Comamonadaceae bacterium]
MNTGTASPDCPVGRGIFGINDTIAFNIVAGCQVSTGVCTISPRSPFP